MSYGMQEAQALDLPPPESSLVLQLLRARELMMRRFRPLLHAAGLTEQQWRVLRLLMSQGPASMQGLAGACCIHPPSLSRMIPRLVARGLVRRQPNLADQRRADISITQQGEAFVLGLKPALIEVHAELQASVGQHRYERARAAVAELVEAMGGLAALESGAGESLPEI